MDETNREPATSGTAEIIELIKEQAAHEPEFSYRDYKIEDYIALGIFWLLALIVFMQFFTRYFLRFSFVWTEEVARYLLVCVAFTGSIMAVRRNSHIFVEFFYQYIPRKAGRVLVTVVDLIRIVYMGIGIKLGFSIVPRTQRNLMSTLPIPLSVVYTIVTLGFALMLWRSVEIAIKHWRDGFVPSLPDVPDVDAVGDAVTEEAR